MPVQLEKGKPFPRNMTLTVTTEKAVELGQQGLKAKEKQQDKRQEEANG